MKLAWRTQTLRPRHRFATSQGGVSEKDTLVVELEHAGVTGRGEVAASRLYGQSNESSIKALEQMRPLLGDDPFAIESVVGRIIAAHDGQRAAIGAVDNALHDWAAQKLGVPVWRLLGLDPPRVSTTFTIGVADEAETREKVREALASGFDRLKVKVGVETDEGTLGAIRAVFDGPLFLDANQAWRPGQAEERIRALARFRPTIIEEPLHPEDWRHMGELRKLGVAPVFADESCQRPADVVRLRDAVDGVNIKFTKCGGIREALRMVHLARGFGLKIMLGCFVSSGLAIAPALAIASLVDFVDLDGHLLLAEDPFPGIGRSGSTIWLDDTPGCGVRAK
ncbi:MAG: dipeptide epimerase [Phycisphaerae bacterium]